MQVRLIHYQFVHARYVYPKTYRALVPATGWGDYVVVGSTWRYATRAANRAVTWQSIIITHSEALPWVPRFPWFKVEYLHPDKLSRAAQNQWFGYAQQRYYGYVVPHLSANRTQWSQACQSTTSTKGGEPNGVSIVSTPTPVS